MKYLVLILILMFSLDAYSNSVKRETLDGVDDIDPEECLEAIMEGNFYPQLNVIDGSTIQKVIVFYNGYEYFIHRHFSEFAVRYTCTSKIKLIPKICLNRCLQHSKNKY